MDKNKIYIPNDVVLPCKLKWAVDNNSMVSSNQIIAYIIETEKEYSTFQNGYTLLPNEDCSPKDKNSPYQNAKKFSRTDQSLVLNQHGTELKEKEAGVCSNSDMSCDRNSDMNGDRNSDMSGDRNSDMSGDRNSDPGFNRDDVNGHISDVTRSDCHGDTYWDKSEMKESSECTRLSCLNQQVKNESTNDSQHSEKSNAINFILNNRKMGEVKKHNNYALLRSTNHGRIHILKISSNPSKEEYIYITNQDEPLCEIIDEICKHEIVFSGLCTNCFLNQEEMNKNKEEQKYFLSPGFLTNDKELYINTDKVIDLEKERIKNIVNNKKLCLVLDLDNTLLHASFFILSININSEVINITTDLDDLEECKENNNVDNNNNVMCDANIGNYQTKGKIEIDSLDGDISDTKKEDNVDGEKDPHIEGDPLSEKCLYSFFYGKGNNSAEGDNKQNDIKSSYENYCDFLAKINTLNLLKHNGKFIHYEDLSDIEIKKKIEKLELSILKTNVKYQKGSYTIYYKLRPGVIQFLQKMHEKYEIYLYTMGTLEHAKSCLFLLDPLKKFFGNRIFSRKDSVNGLKHLNRILPTYRSISICVDDSDYMWKESSYCIKVHGYNYFPEINFLEDIKRKPYFLTKFFALAQSYLNFSSNLYRFINFKCNEHDSMKNSEQNSMLSNSYSNLMTSFGTPMGIICHQEETKICKGGGEQTEDANRKTHESAIGPSCQTTLAGVGERAGACIEGTASNGTSVNPDEVNENDLSLGEEDFLNLHSYNFSREENGEEELMEESHENSLIDLDKEFETDGENEDSLDVDPSYSAMEEENDVYADNQLSSSYLGEQERVQFANHKGLSIHESMNTEEDIDEEACKVADEVDDEDSNNDPNDYLFDHISGLESNSIVDSVIAHVGNARKCIDKKKKKKKKKKTNNQTKNNNYRKELVKEEKTLNNEDSTPLLSSGEIFTSLEDEVICKFISEKKFREYENYVLNFLDNYFEQQRKKEMKVEMAHEMEEKGDHLCKLGDHMNTEDEEDANCGSMDEEEAHSRDVYDEGKTRKSKTFEMMNIRNNLKKVGKEIIKTKVKKIIRFRNLKKKNNINLAISKGKNATQKRFFIGSKNNKKGKEGRQKDGGEYFESFFIPRNLKEYNFKDNDKQLHYLTLILSEIHHIFYKLFEHFKVHKINGKNEDDQIYNYFLRYPIARTILREARKQVLKGCTFNISQLSADIRRSDFMDHILKFGGTISNDNYTHILTVNNMRKGEHLGNVEVSNLMWVERALYTWKYTDPKYYDMNMWQQVHRNFWDVIEYEEKNGEILE
ncbi:NLI interacting factor-like phosphatase, putative (NIF4) [Plasmodium ovale wallikeri]|uniref:protein-serine/threonine phosphatase n=1 Tax=Plasmodium ovale wallikeri TaxID=864142 RepID=A0A1A8YRK9_PLAOA|nr:NLI interacting factor-like phosphatase, putative (NIF4) [Plasmodium ovale wallikeri]SBT34615.1 NLI interacting factor-like phosphatase, putative (NIF4) [Plasmodium ovale wallikeri]